MIKFIDYKKDYLRFKTEYDKAWEDVNMRGDLILRRDIEEFEQRLADYVGTKYAVALSSGTDAIYLALKALGIGRGDEVITSSGTFKATVGAIINSGATPILVDIGKDGLMNMEKIEEKITPKTKVIMPVHIAGMMCDMKRLNDIIEDRDINIIEDQCQGLGAK